MRSSLKKKTSEFLHKGFDSVACKIKLKLVAARLKILRNKRMEQVKVLNREIAKLLEAGQEENARVKVEHVIREEKLVTAYEMIELYCEIITARLPVIESQKQCPLDLREAVASVIFAQARCEEVSELKDVRKHLINKYGKDFADAAVELRQNCGVSTVLVEKLSVKSPDTATKVKALSKIAEEHGIDWKPKSFEEKIQKTKNDYLDGPSSFDDKSNLVSVSEKPELVAQVVQKQETLANLVNDQMAKPESSAAVSSSIHLPTTSKPVGRDPELNSQKTETVLTKAEEQHIITHQQYWSTNFKTAAAAAEAAAKSAEFANLAAIAAANLAAGAEIPREQAPVSSSTVASDPKQSARYVPSPVQLNELERKFVGNSIGESTLQGMGHLGVEGELRNEYDQGNTNRSSKPISRPDSTIPSDMYRPGVVPGRVDGRFQEKISGYIKESTLQGAGEVSPEEEPRSEYDKNANRSSHPISRPNCIIPSDECEPQPCAAPVRVDGRFQEKSLSHIRESTLQAGGHVSLERVPRKEYIEGNMNRSRKSISRGNSSTRSDDYELHPGALPGRVDGRFQENSPGHVSIKHKENEVTNDVQIEVDEVKRTQYQYSRNDRLEQRKQEREFDRSPEDDSFNRSTVPQSAESPSNSTTNSGRIAAFPPDPVIDNYIEKDHFEVQNSVDTVSPSTFEHVTERNKSRKERKKWDKDDTSLNVFTSSSPPSSEGIMQSSIRRETGVGAEASSHYENFTNDHSNVKAWREDFAIEESTEDHLSGFESRSWKNRQHDDQYQWDYEKHDVNSRNSFHEQVVVETSIEDHAGFGEMDAMHKHHTFPSDMHLSYSPSKKDAGKYSSFPSSSPLGPFSEEVVSPQSKKDDSFREDAAPTFDDDDYDGAVIDFDNLPSESESGSIFPDIFSKATPPEKGLLQSNDIAPLFDQYDENNSGTKSVSFSYRNSEGRSSSSMENVPVQPPSSKTEPSPHLSSEMHSQSRKSSGRRKVSASLDIEDEPKAVDHLKIPMVEVAYSEMGGSPSSDYEDSESRQGLNLEKELTGGLKNKNTVRSRRTRGSTVVQVTHSTAFSGDGSRSPATLSNLEEEMGPHPARDAANRDSVAGPKGRGLYWESPREELPVQGISGRSPLSRDSNAMGFTSPISTSSAKMDSHFDSGNQSRGRLVVPSVSTDSFSGSEFVHSPQKPLSRTMKERDSMSFNSDDVTGRDMDRGSGLQSYTESTTRVNAISRADVLVEESSKLGFRDQRKKSKERVEVTSGSSTLKIEEMYERPQHPPTSRRSQELAMRQSIQDPSKRGFEDKSPKPREKDQESPHHVGGVVPNGGSRRTHVESSRQFLGQEEVDDRISKHKKKIADRKAEELSRKSLDDYQDYDFESRNPEAKSKRQTKISSPPESVNLTPQREPTRSPHHFAPSHTVSEELEMKGSSKALSSVADQSSTGRADRKIVQTRVPEQQPPVTPSSDTQRKEPSSLSRTGSSSASPSDSKREQAPTTPTSASGQKSEGLPHVHKKLPRDYDEFISKLEFLRKNAR